MSPLPPSPLYPQPWFRSTPLLVGLVMGVCWVTYGPTLQRLALTTSRQRLKNGLALGTFLTGAYVM